MKVLQLRVMYWMLFVLRGGMFLVFALCAYVVVGTALGVPYLFLIGEEWPEIVDKLPIAAMVLPIFGGVLLCTALKVHELWECVHRDRYAWATVFMVLSGYTALPIVFNMVSIVFGALGLTGLATVVYSYRYRVLVVAGCVGLLFLCVYIHRLWRFDQESKKQAQTT